MARTLVAALAASRALLALARPRREDDGWAEVLQVQTFDWRPDLDGGFSGNLAAASNLAASPAGALGAAVPPRPTMRVTTQHLRTEAPQEDDEALRKIAMRAQALAAAAPDLGGLGGRKLGADSETLLEALWDRPRYRSRQFDLEPTAGEHPCFAGFAHMVNNTDRCGGWVRTYPPVGESVVFKNTGVGGYRRFELRAVVAEHINVWVEEGSSDLHADVSIKAANIYTNQYGLDELRPAEGSNSWMEHECKIMGSMPFMYTCSDRINILVQECGISNAWVMQSDYLRNYPGPATSDSPTNHDIIFYMCQELLDGNPNPYAAANTFAHELAHVIQGGFGFSFNTMTEGGATWLEGPLLNLAPRPMVYAWGFEDWNRILAAHIYANTPQLNARKFYQIHGMFLAYLAQAALLGDQAASSLQNYETFEQADVPFGRSAYDYYLQFVGVGKPALFEAVTIDVQGLHYAFAEALLNYRVAMVAQCILDKDLRPSEPEYQMPSSTQERPYWDCSSFPTYWSAEQSSVDKASADIHYGGAAVARLMLPVNPSVSVAADADPRVRTKVLAAGVSGGAVAEVVELSPGETASFQGAREIYVVQVNVDPSGEMLAPEDRPKLWKKTKYHCEDPCTGQAWWAGSKEGYEYPADQRSALQTPFIQLPESSGGDLELTFDAMWDMEGEDADGSEIGESCRKRGWDGVQVRAIVAEDGDGGKESTVVLAPDEGYGQGPKGEGALQVFADLYPDVANCSSLEGYTGSSGGSWRSQRVSLEQLAGKKVRLEWFFVSDSSGGGEGFWIDHILVRGGPRTLYVNHAGDEMRQVTHIDSIPAGTLGTYDGIPVVAGMPPDYVADKNLAKALNTLAAPWSAVWEAGEDGRDAALRRAYLGWSYSAPTTDTRTARLHPEQEACMLQVAPFRGHVRSATLFTLVDKIGVSAVALAFRDAAAPHGLLGGRQPLVSASDGVQDPGMHRFVLGAGNGPLFDDGDAFLLCVGVAGVKPLPADDPNSLPFLHLPLTRVSTAGDPAAAGATMLLYRPTAAGAGEVGADSQDSGVDPWAGHTFVLRSEFVAAPPPTSAATPGGGFLAKSGGQ